MMIIPALPLKSNFQHDSFNFLMINRIPTNKVQVFGHIFTIAIDRHASPARKNHIDSFPPQVSIDVGCQFSQTHFAYRFQSGLSFFRGRLRFMIKLS